MVFRVSTGVVFLLSSLLLTSPAANETMATMFRPGDRP